MKYEISPMADGSFELVSVVKTNFGGDAVNFVCSGSLEYCESIKKKLERL